MVRKVMLQGYICNANFGDNLHASLFYDRCLKLGFEKVDFFQYKNYGIGDFCRKQIGYSTRLSLLSCFKSDAFVLISGGFLWNDEKNSKDAKIRYRRYILPALIFMFLGKPVYLLGVGGGPVDTLWLRKKFVKLINKAKVVTFRDEATKKQFEDYGVKNRMTVTADTILIINKNMLNPLKEATELYSFANGRKKLLLHIPDSKKSAGKLIDKILPALIRFLEEHKEFALVLTKDNIEPKENTNEKKIHEILKKSNINFYDYKYNDCWQLCSLINEMDCVISLKLHVGVVACALDKSVIAFPVHREKTDNFYKMIDQSERCLNIKNLNVEKAYEQINKFHNIKVHISDELRQKAELNLLVLDDIFEDKRCKNDK